MSTSITTPMTSATSLTPSLPPEVTAALIISIILIFVTLTMLLYANRKFESDRAITACCFLVTMSAQHITLVVGLYATGNRNACVAVALIIHFCELSEAFWTLGMVVQIVLKTTYKTADSASTCQYCALGWITPLFVVASTAGLHLDKYGNNNYCFLPVDDNIIFAFLVPGLLIVMTNFTCLCYILYEYVTTKRRDRKSLPLVLSIVPNARACAVVSLFLILDWTFFILALRLKTGAVDGLWACNKLIESICVFLLFGVFSTEIRTEYERRVGPCCPWLRKSSRAVMDSPSPRPGWRDEISQISNMNENSVILDNDSSAIVFAGLHNNNASNAGSSSSSRGSGSASSHTNSLLNSSGRANTISGSLMKNGNGDAFNREGTSEFNSRPSSRTRIDHKKAKDALNDSSSSLASTMASTLNLKTKLKVFPLRKLNDHEHTRIANTDGSDSQNESGEGSPVPVQKKRVGWGKIMSGKT